MGLFDFGKKDRQLKQLADEVFQLKKLANDSQGNFALQNLQANINRNIPVYPSSDILTHTNRYSTTDDIYSIVRKLATTAAMIPMDAYLVTDAAAVKKFNRVHLLKKNQFNTKELQKKALQLLPETDKVQALMESPSDILSKFEFFEALYTFLFLLGEIFILKERPGIGVNAGFTTSLLIMYPQNVIVKVSDELPRKIVAYDYRVNGVIIYENIPVDDVIHIKYFNPNMDFYGSELRGLAPLTALGKRTSRLESGMNTSVAQLQNGGVETIVFDKTAAATDGAANIIGQRKDNFYKFLRDKNNTGAPFFASGEMGAIQLGLSLANLDVASLANIDFKKLCNAWGVSDILFNSDSASTESNVVTMTKQLYTNTIMPNVYRVRDSLTRGILHEFQDGIVVEEDGKVIRLKGDGKKRQIDVDLSDVTELHEDVGKKVAQYASLPIMIPNMILEELGFPTVEGDPAMDKVYIKSGYTPIDDLQMLPPLVLPDGTNLPLNQNM